MQLKRVALILLLVFSSSLYAATFDGMLTLAGPEFEGIDGENFMDGVRWEENPQEQYFECKDRLGNVSLKLWQKDGGWVSARGSPPGQLKFGRHGSIRVFSLVDEENNPHVAAYFMLASGETHVFRVLYSKVRLSSITWQCEEADWEPPVEVPAS